jgi:hypothetical protein
LFLNNRREGLWLIYSARGVIEKKENFSQGKLNGPFEEFYDGGLKVKGTMVNGLSEGKFFVFNADSMMVAELAYLHNDRISYAMHLKEAAPPEKFTKYLEKTLKAYEKQLIQSPPLLSFTVLKTGELKDVKIIKGINPEIDSAMILAVTQAPHYKPALYDGKAIDQNITSQIALFQPKRVSSTGDEDSLPLLQHYRSLYPPLIQQQDKRGVIFSQ